jgi:Fe-S-cluster containining protein
MSTKNAKSADSQSSECKRCGLCCYHFSFFNHLDNADWQRVVQHASSVLDGQLVVRRLDARMQRFLPRTYPVDGEGTSDAAKIELARPPANEFTLCPFLAFDHEEGIFACTIHEFNARACRSFHCNGGLALGIEMELCTACWVDDFDPADLGPPYHKGERPCEQGLGCREFEHRVLFFVAYATRHRTCSASARQLATRLHDCILAAFQKVEEETREGCIDANLAAPVMDRLHEIDSILRASVAHPAQRMQTTKN